MKILFSFLLIILSVNSFGQFTKTKTQSLYGGLSGEGSGGFGRSTKLLTLQDGYLLCTTTASGIGGNKKSTSKGKADIWVVRLDSTGETLWDKTIGTAEEEWFCDVVEVNGEFILITYTNQGVSGDKSTPTNGNVNYWMIKLDKDGNKIWDKSSTNTMEHTIATSLLKLDNSILATGLWRNFSNYSLWLRKLDFNGNVIWDSIYKINWSAHYTSILKGANCFYICGFRLNSQNVSDADYGIMKLDTNGVILWDKSFGGKSSEMFSSAVYLSDHTILMTGRSRSDSGRDKTEKWRGVNPMEDIWVIKVDSNGNKIWDKTIGGYDWDVATSAIEVDKKIYIVGSSESNKTGDKSENRLNQFDVWFLCLDLLGNKIFDKTIGGGAEGLGIDYINNNFVITARTYPGSQSFYRTVDTIGGGDVWLFRFGDSSISNSSFKSITGKVFADLNSNCLLDNNEANLKNKIIYNHTDKNYYSTNSDNYTIYIHNGDTAKLELINLNDSVFNFTCQSNKIQTVILKDTIKSGRLDFPVQPKKRGHCLDITSFSNGILRAGRWGYYKLDFVNNGFDTAYNAKLEITIDTSLVDSISSSFNYSLVGNKLVFSLGNVKGFETRTITYGIKLKGRFLLGTSICHKALISPTCNLYTTTNYDSTKITAKTKCISKNKMELELKNESSYNQKIESDIYVYKDDSLSNLSTLKLNANETKVLTYHLDANTVFTSKLILNNNDPIHPIIILHDDKCALLDSFKSKNPVLNFHRHHDSRAYEENCDIVRGSYDPNIKSVQPAGITSENYTSTGTELSYRIDFQNTGNDTAFRIVVTDSLSESLNIATFIPGTSSHPYSVEFEKRKVKFIFDPIALVDSVTNEPGSHGYVTFKIKHNSNIKPKTKIENGASIYFDYNPPIITNKVFNTIYDVLLIVRSTSSVDKTEKLPINVYPNPVTNTLNIGLSEPVTQLSIEVLDIQGKLIKKILSPADLNVQISTENMESGIYILRCYSHDKVLIEQKIQVIK